MRLRSKVYGAAAWSLLPGSVRDGVSILDVRIAGEAVRHGVASVDALTDFADVRFEAGDAAGEVLESVSLLLAVDAPVCFRDFARGSLLR